MGVPKLDSEGSWARLLRRERELVALLDVGPRGRIAQPRARRLGDAARGWSRHLPDALHGDRRAHPPPVVLTGLFHRRTLARRSPREHGPIVIKGERRGFAAARSARAASPGDADADPASRIAADLRRSGVGQVSRRARCHRRSQAQVKGSEAAPRPGCRAESAVSPPSPQTLACPGPALAMRSRRARR